MTNMYKVIHPFSAWINNCYVPVFIKIKIEEKSKGECLSISGVEGPLRNGNAAGGCGQIDMHMDNDYLSRIELENGWTMDMVSRLLYIYMEGMAS